MGHRRADGALEADVLAVLWSSEVPLTPAEVRERLAGELAYTTVMTVLSRLWQKGLASRLAQGRAFAYEAVLSESELTTRRMTEALDATSNRDKALASFVGSLSKRDVRHLQRLLGEEKKAR